MQPIIMDWIQNVSLLVLTHFSLEFFYILLSSVLALDWNYTVLCLFVNLCFFFIWTAEAFVGKGYFKKRVSYHAKGKCGIKVRPECRLTVVVRETTPEEEAEIARIKVSKFKKLTRRETRLVPHQLIETTPIWSRKSKTNSQEASAAAWIILFQSSEIKSVAGLWY